MIPGFVTTYKDKDNYVHLYFYPGIDVQNHPIYKDIDLTQSKFKYVKYTYLDNAVDYKFYDKRICKINCKLLDFNNEKHIEILNII